jgi:hypothetical protein
MVRVPASGHPVLLAAALVLGGTTGPVGDSAGGAAAAPVTYHVAASGSDANPGTAASPFRTIQRAADRVLPGDVVIVGDGVYTDHDGDGSVVRIRRGGTSGARVTFRAANRWKARVDGQGGATANGFEVDAGAGWVRIEGFEITGVANRGSESTGRGSASGIDLYDGGHDSEIVGNHIHDIGRVCTLPTNTNGQVAIFVQQPNVTIEGNRIHDIGRVTPGERGCPPSDGPTARRTLDHGIYLNGRSPGANGTIIRNNVIYNTAHGWAIQFYPGSLTGVHVVNNTFAFGNPAKGYTHIVLDASLSASSIVNNIFHDRVPGRTIDAVGFSGTITIDRNLTTGAAIADRVRPGMSVGRNVLSRDALFVDAEGGDFRLRDRSPAIDAGVVLATVTVDFDGRARPRGAGCDLGAYEF